jgi:myo-inositol-hexaphosphate 3-phosphohydrolase/ribosomal protein L24E
MPATHSQTTLAARRRTIGAALGLVLVVAAAPFLRSASAAQPTTDATASFETTPVAVKTPAVKTNDPAIWVNPTDPAKSLILGANDDGLAAYDLAGVKQAQAAIPATAPAMSSVDTRNNVTVAGAPASVAMSVGAGAARIYTIDPATGKLADKTGASAMTPAWHVGSISTVRMYQSPLTHNSYAFVMSGNGHMVQYQLIDDAVAGKVKLQTVRGYGSTLTPTTDWDLSTGAGTVAAPGGCVADDAMKTLYVSEKGAGIWKFGAEPGDPTTGTLIDTPTTATPAGHLTDNTLGLALVKTSDTAGYLIASSPAAAATDPMADSFMVYDRAPGNAFIRSFHVLTGAFDACDHTDGIDAAAGTFGASFTSGLFVCQDQTNRNTKAPNGPQNYKLVPLQQIVDPAGPAVTPTTVVTAPPVTTPTTAPGQVQVPNRSGYWMVGSDGKVFAFGEAKSFGDTTLAAGAQAVDLEPSPSGNGYWIVDDFGHVFARGDARAYGDVDKSLLSAGEVVTSISSTKSGNGYWVFTTMGRVIPFGDATFLGDMSKAKLNGPVLDSIATASGNGYYMVASDGGIFSFGDAAFKGSMGAVKLNAPVQSLVPTVTGSGYWLVASDGGIFAFGDAPFKGSMGAIKLNKPVTGMVRFGNGYLMVATDGGIFSFSDKKFQGSLGDNPPAKPITSAAVLDVAPATL